MLEVVLEQRRETLENESVKNKYMCLNGTPLGSVKMQSIQLPQVTELKYMGSTLQSDEDVDTEETRKQSVAGTTGGRCQGFHAIRGYNHMLRHIFTR